MPDSFASEHPYLFTFLCVVTLAYGSRVLVAAITGEAPREDGVSIDIEEDTDAS